MSIGCIQTALKRSQAEVWCFSMFLIAGHRTSIPRGEPGTRFLDFLADPSCNPACGPQLEKCDSQHQTPSMGNDNPFADALGCIAEFKFPRVVLQ